MIARTVKLAVVAAFSISLAACSSSWSTSNTNRVGSAQGTNFTPAAEIIVTEEDITDRPYQVLGDIEVTVNKTTIFNADPTREMVNEKLREEAQELRADAVILVRYGSVGIGLASWGSLDGKGRAVAFTE